MLLFVIDAELDQISRVSGRHRVERRINMGPPGADLVERRARQHAAFWPRMAVTLTIVIAVE